MRVCLPMQQLACTPSVWPCCHSHPRTLLACMLLHLLPQAMVVAKVVEEAHEGEIVSLAYNKTRKEIYSAADGDKVIKVH